MATLSTGTRDWAWLPDLILDQVLSNLISLQHYLRFSSVCKQWHSVAEQQRRHRISTTHNQVPLLLVPTENRSREFRSLYSVAHDRLLDSELEIPCHRRCCGSSHGWLAFMEGDYCVTLYNPFTRARILLPPVNDGICFRMSWKAHRKHFPYTAKKVVLSADPSLFPDDYVVAALTDHPFRTLALIRPGRDKKWTRFKEWGNYDEFQVLLCDVVFCEGGKWVYVSGFSGMLGRMDLEVDWTGTGTGTGTKYEPLVELMVRPMNHLAVYEQTYLVETTRYELLMILRVFKEQEGYELSWETKEIKVFKLQDSKFIEIEDLNGDALFIGDNYSTAVSAKNFEGIEANCIYYSDDFTEFLPNHYRFLGPHDIGKFNLILCFSIMLNTLVPPLSPPPPPTPICPDQFPILGSGMNSSLILPTSPNNVFDIGDERLMSHYPVTGDDVILPTSPNIGFDVEGERLISHYPHSRTSITLPTSPNSFFNGEDDPFSPPEERLMSHFGALQPTSPNSFLDGGEPNRSSGSCYSINGSSPTLLPTTSPKTILNSQEHPGERLISHYSTDGSSSLLLPTSPKNFLNSRDNQDCPPGERLKRSHYSMERSTPVLPTSPNNLLDSEDNRFCPSDERLISHYLMQKMLGNEDQVTKIPEVDILSREPPDLLGIAGDEQCYKEAYFFYRRRSYFTSKDRCKRTTGDGYWKPTGKLREIRNGANGEVIGSKRCLVFHYGRSVGQSTGYTMHEYSTSAGISSPQPVMDLVLCKVMKKSSKAQTVTKQSNKKARTVPPPAPNETVNINTPPPLQREEEALGSHSSSTQTDGDSAKEIAAFPDIELEIDGEIYRLPGKDFDFDFEISDIQLQQQRMLKTEYFPSMVQQSG
ncbi:NAC domain-containing protein 100 [Linum perenne]